MIRSQIPLSLPPVHRNLRPPPRGGGTPAVTNVICDSCNPLLLLLHLCVRAEEKEEEEEEGGSGLQESQIT